MSDMNRRLKKAEKALNLDSKQIVVRITTYTKDKEKFDLSNPSKEWLTYPEAVEKSCEQNGLIVLHEYAEIEARKAAKLSNNGVAAQ